MRTLLRLAKFRQRLSELGADGAIVTSRENVAYLTGFSGSAGTLVIAPGRAYLVTDGRYEIRAREVAKGYRVTLGKSLADVVNELPGRPRLAYEPTHLTDSRLSELQAGVRRAELRPESRVLEEIRAVKDPDEIALIERAAAIADEAWAALQPSIVPGVTEVELSNQLEAAMKARGASGVGFDSIVASGPNSAIPHHETGDRRIRRATSSPSTSAPSAGLPVGYDAHGVHRRAHRKAPRGVQRGIPRPGGLGGDDRAE